MRLDDLLRGLEVQAIIGDLPAEDVRGLVYDSRRAGPGQVFAALAGAASDGHAYLEMAAKQGALAALVQRPAEVALAQIQVPDSRLALAMMADRFYARPSRHLCLVGVTGTNGKTTVSYLVESLLAQRGPAGLLGTVEQRYPGKRRASSMTTPESVDLQALLAEMLGAGVKGVVMEVSSHALEQHRAAGCRFDAAVFTNLTRDHLDYHGDMDAYFQAKRRLFNQLLPQAKRQGKDPAAVICADDPKGSHLAGEATGLHLRTLTYGFSQAARVRGISPVLKLSGGRCLVDWPAGSFEMSTPLVGLYNLQNALAATAVGLALDFEPAEIQRALDAVPGVPGRLQRVVGAPGDPSVFVDYAHTDQALASVLAALRPLTPGRLICVFGAGGDRDQGKRPLMGRAVGIGADLAVLTSDNPRSEDPLAVMAMVEQGLTATGSRLVRDLDTEGPAYVSEPSRAAAIELAVAAAGPQDVVLIAGKGHEDYQIVGRERRHFDDREQALAALGRRHEGEANHAGA
ncbi:UDP-N-acetylmuramoyl-L-alanyl-D-glutamate--2,6-diaminopimelate ligase [Desulfoferula mesophila]|uniref:UDP-N-acetylmuramoyl-L-alanyl-D-glutamate--2,6-diaminopimelate ligase n=1 Tax=Desulfoferula mesophila TaxID=3058419 RepID=A0AAU9F4U6_9BACT|nr:UDP-N-acetylmuramoyl-L-alanyl-D-glutamate--2,6-diaminopimelate ligase [Desulfoferula mesophilus]